MYERPRQTLLSLTEVSDRRWAIFIFSVFPMDFFKNGGEIVLFLFILDKLWTGRNTLGAEGHKPLSSAVFPLSPFATRRQMR